MLLGCVSYLYMSYILLFGEVIGVQPKGGILEKMFFFLFCFSFILLLFVVCFCCVVTLLLFFKLYINQGKREKGYA